MRVFRLSFTVLLGLIAMITSCKSGGHATESIGSSDRMLVLTKPQEYNRETIIDSEVTIYPGAFISTTGPGKLIFTKKVNILGESQVFDENINVEFRNATISKLNPAWFGAKGYDQMDDTDAFQKTFRIAKEYTSSINIEVPIGKFIITQTLVIGNDQPNRKSINLIGHSMSTDSKSGSSLEWNGTPGLSLLTIRNYCLGLIENMDFSAASDRLMKHNIEMVPFDYQVIFRNCTFSGCAGTGSANVNINNGNNLQVSEIYFDNCAFRGYTGNERHPQTESAVIGGIGNTKDFAFTFCSFLGYDKGAINIEVSDIMRVESCTFAFNDVDIICLLCNSMISGNYSEHSKSFFQATVSVNFSFTTMMNNCFYGTNDADYVIREGAGNLVLINNNFGGMGGNDPSNRIRWQQSISSNIHSIGNFFRNNPSQTSPFYHQQNELRGHGINSFGDIIGTDGMDIKRITIEKQQ